MNRCDDTVNHELSTWEKASDESFEALEKMCEKTVSDPNSTLYKYLNGDDEKQKTNNVIAWQKTSDESFEALERMCDKTASDPNSTLFQYLHSDRKEQVLADVKKRSADGNFQKENDILLMKISNCTLLDDVEPPSRIWENTICGDTILQTSPIKMVGLLRPSTIIEEAPDESTNSDVSSQMSFRTATKSASSDVSSTAYETAHNSTASINRNDFSKTSQGQEMEIIDVDHILYSALAKNEQKRTENNESAAVCSSLETMDATMIESAPLNNNFKENSNENEISLDLIDFEKTFSPRHDSPHSSILSDEEVPENKETDPEVKNNEKVLEDENKSESYNGFDDSIIEILSDDDDENVNEGNNRVHSSCIEQQPLFTNIKQETTLKGSSFSTNHDSYTFDKSLENNKENCDDDLERLEETSMQFNDTMEEVEYMLKKGMEYMAVEASSKRTPQKVKVPLSPKCSAEISKIHPKSPMTYKMPNTTVVSSSAPKVKSYAYATPVKIAPLSKGSNSSSKRYDIDIKPFPKFDIFPTPPVHARTKELSNKQQKFSHIVSPIGTYMKKTAKTPLMSSIQCQNKDYFNSTAILELENESRLHQPYFSTDTKCPGLRKLPGLSIDTKRPLPKKAYISSNLKHIVDERTPVTIPGGKKIQKYLENAMMPAVLRHEGKFKMTGRVSNKINTMKSAASEAATKLPLKVSDTNSTVSANSASYIPQRSNTSLADLSVMSGDISMYKIMDAQKF